MTRERTHAQRRERPRDRDLTFLLQVYRDYEAARRCLRSLRRHYRTSRLILISDGDDDPRFARLARRNRGESRWGARLYPVATGGRMIQRMLRAFLDDPSDFLVKIDTDTRIHRRFRYLLDGRCVSGTLEWETAGCRTNLDFPNVQGGCVIFTRQAARELFDSGILISDQLLDNAGTYADVPDILRRARDGALISFDFVTRWACRRLGIPLEDFDEVRSVFRGEFGRDGDGYAVTHPHKLPASGTARRARIGALLPRSWRR
jgi:hypothetical protein